MYHYLKIYLLFNLGSSENIKKNPINLNKWNIKEKLWNETKSSKKAGNKAKDLLKGESKDADVCYKRLKNFIQKPEKSLMSWFVYINKIWGNRLLEIVNEQS
jgi:hypothetical protein